MGLKRSFDEGDLQELSFKRPKQLQSIDQLTSLALAEINPPDGGFQKAGEVVGVFCESQCKCDNSNVVSDFNNKEFETRARISWVTSSTSEEDAGSGAVLCSSVLPEDCEFSFPRTNAQQFEDPYSSLLNSSPRKEVPLGPDHQADVPVWDAEVVGKHSISSINDNNDDNGGLMQQGTCVVLMPDLDFSADLGKTKDGRLDCRCLDGGSVRCVQQHVKEAREELKETIGIKKFVDLGFLEMGEEVAHKWTEEEERLFREVVYSNPVLHGNNFWVHLSAMFPSRTKWELVSYYFNVFMLRRRAAQNRSSWLDIDSDDDEWKGNGEGPFGVTGEDKNSAVVYFINQDVRVEHGGDDSTNEYGDDDDNSSNGNDEENDNNDDGDDNLQVNVVDATENAKGEYHMSKEKYENSLDDHRFDLMQHHMDGSLGSFKEFLDVQEDSCTSFEGQPYMTGSYYPIGERVVLQESKVNIAWQKFLLGNGDGCSDRFGPQHALEPCDAKVLDATYSTGLLKSVDLLPTCNMMEEIFGPSTWNSKSSNDKSIS